MGMSVYDEYLPRVSSVTIQDSDGTTPKVMAIGLAKGTRIDAILVSSTSIAPRVFNLLLGNGGGPSLTSVSIPAGAGFGATPPVDVLSLVPGYMSGGIILPYGEFLSAGLELALLTGETILVATQGGDV